MAGVSTSHLIIFIASLIVAASIAGTVTDSVGRLGDSLGDRSVDVSQQVRTDVEIISDGSSDVYNASDGNVTLLVKNTGSRPLPPDPDQLDVILDGTYRSTVTVETIDGADWTVGNVARLNVSAPSLSSGDHRVKLVMGGDEEVFRFRT